MQDWELGPRKENCEKTKQEENQKNDAQPRPHSGQVPFRLEGEDREGKADDDRDSDGQNYGICAEIN